ncbi:MAG: hypothetical protein HQM09_20645 [Candidatus Riflebacteria bacterium]|nr:hypothetical protein [Candidatus Riflebacteria bacterium]
MNKFRSLFLLIFILLVFAGSFPMSVIGLAPDYQRDGEVYLLVGEPGIAGMTSFQGVYREYASTSTGLKMGYLYNPGAGMGIVVDSERNIYTFDGGGMASYTVFSGNTPIQIPATPVTASPEHADWERLPPYHTDYHGGGRFFRSDRAAFAQLRIASGSTTTNATGACQLYKAGAIQSAIGTGAARIYFYTREKSSSVYTLTRDSVSYTGSVIGYPGDAVGSGTRWIGISLRDQTSDWVYLLGTRIICEWYQQATNKAPPPMMQIDSVCVSNQWNQKGGIIFAYDRAQGTVYKFKRDETASAPITREGFDWKFLGQDIDDIKADGAGNMYFTKTVAVPPTETTLPFMPAFNMNTDVAGIASDSAPADPIKLADMAFGHVIFAQSYFKSIFKWSSDDEAIISLATQPIGSKFFQRSFIVPKCNWATLTATLPDFGSRLTAGGGCFSPPVMSGPVGWPDTYSNPCYTELGVINIPRPPVVFTFPIDNSHINAR